MHPSIAIALFLGLSIVASLGWAQEVPLGSTASLEWIRNPSKPPVTKAGIVPNDNDWKDSIVSLSPEPVPAFRYRFWPSKASLRPGSAQTHFYRALIHCNTVAQGQTKEEMQQFNEILNLESELVPIELARIWSQRYSLAFQELESMALCEDQSWDLRFRDLRGKQIWDFRLEEVQNARNLARILRLKLVVQLADGDYAGFANSIQQGFRLAALLGQGESLIQCLVSVAIEHMMYASIEYAIHFEGAPNFYWALRTLPAELADISSAIEIELEMARRTFSILDESKVLSHSDPELTSILQSNLTDLRDLVGQSNGFVQPEILLALLLTLGSDAKQKLFDQGESAERIASMTDLQATLLHAGRELRIRSDQILKASKVKDAAGLELSSQIGKEFDDWLKLNRTSLSGVTASLLFPAVAQVHAAQVRIAMVRKRLIAFEALRLFAANHRGRLPKSLSELVGTPIDDDPYSNQPFTYHIETTPSAQRVTLTSEKSPQIEEIHEQTFNFPPVSK